MPIEQTGSRHRTQGFSLIETIVFMVVVSIALVSLTAVFNQSVVQSVDPAVRIRALEHGQALMDEILARRFDQNSPTGGIPACGTAESPPCAGINPDGQLDDVGDYHGWVDNSHPYYQVSATVIEAGSELGLDNHHARRITVRVDADDGSTLVLSAYKVNF